MKEVVRAIITNEEGSALLGLRARGYMQGWWALIGGKIDPGESPRNAIRREVWEEVGVEFAPEFYLVEIDQYSIPGERWVVYYYFGPLVGVMKINKNEVGDVCFVNSSDLERLNIAFDGKVRLRQFFEDR